MLAAIVEKDKELSAFAEIQADLAYAIDTGGAQPDAFGSVGGSASCPHPGGQADAAEVQMLGRRDAEVRINGDPSLFCSRVTIR